MMENTQLVNKMEARLEVVEEIGGSIEADAKLIEYEIASYLKDMEWKHLMLRLPTPLRHIVGPGSVTLKPSY